MAKKTVGFNDKAIGKLPNDRPVLYRIKDGGGNTKYVGIAKKGRVQERLLEHLPGSKDPIPGRKVQIEQMSRISDAAEKEARVIARSKPPLNKKCK